MPIDSNEKHEKNQPSEQAIQELQQEAAGLPVQDILDVCYAFSHDSLRLEIYLNVLRTKGSATAQTAACLICFDLARKGNSRFELEFQGLIPVFQEYTAEESPGFPRLIDSLVGGSEYLKLLLKDLEAALEYLDPRERTGKTFDIQELGDEEIQIDLLGEEDFDIDELEFFNDEAFVQRQVWEKALSTFIGADGMSNALLGDKRAGFFCDSRTEMDRVEKLIQEATSVKEAVPEAEAMLPLAELFLAAHMRSKNLFGRANQERLTVLESGLTHFTELSGPPDEFVSWLTHPTATKFSWDKVAELLLDYIEYLGSDAQGETTGDPISCASGYIFAGRAQPPAPRLLEEGRERRRR
jgi:hypothetical protein